MGVSEFQRKLKLPETGAVDDVTWQGLMQADSPTLFDRVLQLTSAFEGHTFGSVSGNWDGAWLTWGIIGFTLKSGQIARILLETDGNIFRGCNKPPIRELSQPEEYHVEVGGDGRDHEAVGRGTRASISHALSHAVPNGV
jgi:hypothetical protein